MKKGVVGRAQNDAMEIDEPVGDQSGVEPPVSQGKDDDLVQAIL